MIIIAASQSQENYNVISVRVELRPCDYACRKKQCFYSFGHATDYVYARINLLALRLRDEFLIVILILMM